MNLNEFVVEVPQAEAVAVEYPGFIRNTQKALHTLGGIDDIAAAVSSRHYLKLKLRPEDRTSHPLYGERLEQTRLLLRIAQPRQQPSGATTSGCAVNATGAGHKAAPAAAARHGSSGSRQASGASAGAPQPAATHGGGGGSGAAPGVTARLVARVSPTFRFPGLADYAFIPHDPLLPARSRDMLPYDQRPDRAEPTKAPQPLLLIPQLFSWLDLPQDYAFKQVQSRVHLRVTPRADPNWGDAPVISFYAEGVPPPVAATAGGVAAAAAAAAAAAEATKPAAAAGTAAAAADANAQPADSAAAAAPAAAAAGGGNPGDVRAYRVLEAEVSRLLAQRPVWGLELMRERCAASATVQTAMPGGACDAVAVERVVQRLCYRFKTGPWRGLFIRRGYDPRADVEARKYQAIIYSLPNNWYRSMLKAGVRTSLHKQAAAPAADGSAAAASASLSQAAAGRGAVAADAASPAAGAAAAGAAGAGGVSPPPEAVAAAMAAAWSPLAPCCQDDLHFFRALPTQQSTTLQLGDLRLKEVQDTLQEPLPVADAARCSEKTGWFSNAALQRMQNAVQQRFLQLMEQLAPPGAKAQAAAAEAAAAATAASADGAASDGGAKAPRSGNGAAAAATRGGDVEMTDAAASGAAVQPPRPQPAAASGAAADEALRALIAQMNLRGLSEPGGDGSDLGVARLFGSDDEDDEFRLLDDERDDEDDPRAGAGRRRRGMEMDGDDGVGVAAGAEAGRGREQRRGGGDEGGAGTRQGAGAQRAASTDGGAEAAGEASDWEDSVYESEYDIGGDEDEDDEDEDADGEGDEEGGGGRGGVVGRRPPSGGDMYGAGAYGRATVPYDGVGVAGRHLGGGGAGGMFGSDDEDEAY